MPTGVGLREAVTACRTYTAGIVEAVKPTRILVLGETAKASVFNRWGYPRVRNGYQWLRFDGLEIPVFFLPKLGPTFGNKLLTRAWEDDLKWALKATPDRPPWEQHTTVIQTVAQAEDAVADLRDSRCVVFDTETYGNPYRRSEFMVLCLAAGRIDSDVTYTWPTRDKSNPAIRPLLDLLQDSKVGMGGWNLKYDVVAVEEYFGIECAGKMVDPMLVHKLLDCTQAAGLDACSEQIGCGGSKSEAHHYVEEAVKDIRKFRRMVNAKLAEENYERGTGFKRRLEIATQLTMDDPPRCCERRDVFTEGYDSSRLVPMFNVAVAMHTEHPKRYAYAFMPSEVEFRYCARDTMTTSRNWRRLWPELCRTEDVKLAWDEIVQPATRAVSRIERTGMYVDSGALSAFRSHLEMKTSELESQILALSEGYDQGEVNIRSTSDLQNLLFGTLKLPVVKKTSGGKPSTDRESLEEIKGHHPIVPLLLQFRTVTKLQGTYGDGLAPHVMEDSRIHCSLKITGTETGRMSCKEPNLQTIPSRGDYAKQIKNVFAAPVGYKLIQFDYSQLELRVAAILSGDPLMREIYEQGRDYHSETAAMIAPSAYGVEFVRPDKAMREKQPQQAHHMDDIRRAAKAVNFGLLYGMGDASLAATTKVSEAQAAKMRSAVFGKLRTLKSWIDQRVRDAERRGYSSTYWGGQPARRRYLWGIGIEGETQYAKKTRSNAKNASFNSPVQGSASDYCMASLAAIDTYLREDGIDGRVVMTVHDSIILEVVDRQVDEVAPEVIDIMSGWPSDGVPLVVDCEFGQSWGALKPWPQEN